MKGKDGAAFCSAVCLYTNASGIPDQLCGTSASACTSAATQLPGQYLTVYSLPMHWEEYGWLARLTCTCTHVYLFICRCTSSVSGCLSSFSTRGVQGNNRPFCGAQVDTGSMVITCENCACAEGEAWGQG